MTNTLPELLFFTPEQEWEQLIDEAIHDRCKYYATDIIRMLAINEKDFSDALTKGEKALEILHIPIQFHVRRVYRSFETGMISDMKLSPLAAFFISIHIDPSNSNAANLQWYLAKRYGLK